MKRIGVFNIFPSPLIKRINDVKITISISFYNDSLLITLGKGGRQKQI